MTYKTLVKLARAARRHSYSPYSHFRVGAALLTDNGKVYSGCNIESSSYGLTICGERTAIFKAISEGQRKFKAIAIATDEDAFTEPCGASKNNGETKVLKMSDLLPHPFGPKNLKKKR
jgi:cytidine deaminase